MQHQFPQSRIEEGLDRGDSVTWLVEESIFFTKLPWQLMTATTTRCPAWPVFCSETASLTEQTVTYTFHCGQYMHWYTTVPMKIQIVWWVS